MNNLDDSPEFEDGHDYEGFVGGCKRLGCHIYTKDALVVSSCQAKKCHPETCCCRENEGAIIDYKKITYGAAKGQTYFGIVKYGNTTELELELKYHKGK